MRSSVEMLKRLCDVQLLVMNLQDRRLRPTPLALVSSRRFSNTAAFLQSLIRTHRCPASAMSEVSPIWSKIKVSISSRFTRKLAKEVSSVIFRSAWSRKSMTNSWARKSAESGMNYVNRAHARTQKALVKGQHEKKQPLGAADSEVPAQKRREKQCNVLNTKMCSVVLKQQH